MRLGMLARQEAIGLAVPKWLVLSVSDFFREEMERKSRNSNVELPRIMASLVRGAATAGVLGVTIVANWTRQIPNPSSAEYLIGSQALGARPYFTTQIADVNALRRIVPLLPQPVGLAYLTRGVHGGAPARPAPLDTVPGVLVDDYWRMVGVATNPLALLRQIEAAEPEYWADLPNHAGAVGGYVIEELSVLLAVNALCKPDAMSPGQVMFATDYVDHVVAGAFNELGLRARWKKD